MDPQPAQVPATHSLVCPACQKVFRVAQVQPGRTYRCKSCQVPLRLREDVNGAASASSTPSSPPPAFASEPTVLMPPPSVSGLPGQVAPEAFDELELKPVGGRAKGSDLTRLLPPSFQGYRVIKELARGGMGAVLLAEQTQLRRQVALKVMLPGVELQDPLATERFVREARSIAKLRHPHILEVYEAGEVNGMPFLSMEFVEGHTLAHFIAGNRLGQKQIAELLSRVARALAFAHAHGVIHRDIKPENIMIRHNGEPVVMDFGLAKDFAAQSMKLSLTGNVMGTPAYMSPEQAQGLPIDETSDVYSLGAVLYEALARRPPFEGHTAVATIYQVVNARPTPLREINREVDEALARICLKTLEKDTRDRYASMDELAGDLDRYREGMAVAAHGPDLRQRARAWARGHVAACAWIGAGVALLALGALGLYAGWWGSGKHKGADPYAGLTQGSLETRLFHLKALAGDLLEGRIPPDSPQAAEARQALRQAAADEAPEGAVAVAALETLVKLEDPEAPAVLKAQLDPRRPVHVRRAAVEGLGKLRPSDTGASLVQALKTDPALEVRLAALEALSTLPDPSILLFLIELSVRGEPPALAAAARHKLTQLRKPEAVLSFYAGGRGTLAAQVTGEMLLKKEAYERQLEEALEETNPNRAAAPRKPEAFEGAAEKLLRGERAERLQAAFDLGVLADARSEQPLEHALRDQDADVALAAAEALGKLSALKAPQRIVELLRVPAPSTRRAAARAYGLAKPPPDGKPLAEALSVERDGGVQAEMAQALGRLRYPGAAAPLLAVLQDGAPPAKRKAAWALGQLGDKNAAGALVEALERAGGDAELKEELAGALAALTGESLGTEAAKWRERLRQKP